MVNNTGIVEARSVSMKNGVIRLEGGASGVVSVSGKLDASGANAGERGGRIEVTGEKVGLMDGALLDASGRTGGGTILVGGDYQGKNAMVRNAERSYVAATATIRADAIEAGDGGKAVVWADGDTRFHGAISARGGDGGGNGGLVEVSGKQNLAFDGRVDTSAVLGAVGTLLLDPDDLYISTAAVGGALPDATNPFQAIDGVNNYYVLASTLNTLPAATAVQLQASNNIIFQADLTMLTSAAGSVTMTAVNGIQMGGFDLSTANGSASMTAGAGGISNLGTINLGTGTLTLNTPGSITQNAGDLIQGTTALVKQGTGTLTFSSANTYTGATAVNAGTLRLGAANRIADTSAVTVASGATFDLNSLAETVGSIAGGGNITLGTATLTAGGDGTSTTFSGTIGGTGGFTKTGAGALTLSGTNTYTGATTISAGTLRASGGSAIADTSAVTLANIASAALDLSASETVGTLSGGGAAGGNLTLNANTLTVNQAANATYSGIASGTGGITKQGANTLTLSGANTYTGITTVTAGTLALGASNVLANASSAVVNGGTLALAANSDTMAGVQLLSGSITSTTGVLTSTSNYDLQSGTVSAILAGAVGVNKSTAGAVTLSGANTYTGATAVNAGTLTLGANNVLANASTVVVNGGTLSVNTRTDTVAGVQLLSGSITGTTGVLSSTTAYDLQSGSVSAILAGAVGLNKTTPGTVTLAGANTYTGTTAVNGGTLQLGAANRIADTSAVTVASGATFDLNSFAETVGSIAGAGNITLGTVTLTAGGDGTSTTFSGTISGTGGLTKTGAGALTLSGTNAYTGTTTISAGTLRATGGSAIADTSAVTMANIAGATLDVNASETIGTLSGGGTTGGNITLNASTLAVKQAANGTYTGIVSGTGGIDKQGTGVLTLSGANTYTGATAVNAGTLRLGAANRIADTSAVTVASGAIFDLNSLAETVGSIAGGGSITLGTATLTAGGDGTSTTFSGAISGTGGLTKAGAGTLTLSGTNTYTGATTISAGTLRASGGSAIADTSAVTLANTAGAALDVGTRRDRRHPQRRRRHRWRHHPQRQHTHGQPSRQRHLLGYCQRHRRHHQAGRQHAHTLGGQHLHRCYYHQCRHLGSRCEQRARRRIQRGRERRHTLAGRQQRYRGRGATAQRLDHQHHRRAHLD